ncbi:MAG: SusC/RagA family TonB-linked outer membrane protein [Clostridium sp.]|nr:SusC/RagA family TonB-linked outer membrane protein [Bacteroides sp.]MCM1198174.1 SusC/RagA family TonB-linked outer membrane protein [Clostridium sp.]
MTNHLPKVTHRLLAGLILMMILVSGLTVHAQESRTTKTVTGTVLEEDGKPSAGVAVMVKGTGNGTLTDEKGEFTLKVEFAKDSATPVLVFSCLGKETQEHKCTKDSYRIIMKDLLAELVGAVINTGYQKLDRRMSASSVASISGADVLQSNAISIDNMLQGKIPGMTVVGSSSTPGAATKIRIRGTSTISGNREPLWVVDGVILDDPVSISTEELNDLDNVNLIGNAISGLNPMDIEKIDVLKDASATAIYGVRAANGVIVVTTKRGKQGAPRVNYSGTVTVTERPSYNKLNLMNSQERIEVSKEIASKGLDYRFTPAAIGYEGLLYDLYDRKISYDQFLGSVQQLESMNTDWFDLLYRTSVSHRHNLSISGANDKVNYYVSGAYTDENANVKGTGVNQYNAMAKVQVNFIPQLTGTVQLRANISEKDYQHSSISPYSYAYNTSRAIPAFNADGTYAFYNAEQGYNAQPLEYNILNEIENSGRTMRTDAIYFNANLEWKIITGLRATGTFAINTSSTSDKEWYNDRTYAAAKLRMLNYGVPFPDADTWKNDMCKLPYGGELKTSNTRNFGYTARLQLDYSKYIRGHHISAAAGYEARSTKYTGISSTQWGYLPDRGESFVQIDPAQWPKYNEMVLNSPNTVTNKLSNTLSFYGVLSYAYKSRYIINANVRTDGSNKFGRDKSTRFLPIWSVSARWNIMNENFLKDVMWMNELAIKGSYGIQGNVSDDQTPSMIIKLGSVDNLSGDYLSTLSKLPNPYLKWEKTNSWNIALDFAFLDNRISGTFEYYYKKGNDQIVMTQVSPTTGTSSMSLNVGDIMNRGYELIINAVPVRTKDFRWSLSFNSARNVNKVTDGGMTSEYTYAQYTDGSAVLKGYPINSFFSYKFAGLDGKGLPTFHDTEETEGATKAEMFSKVFTLSGNRLPDMQGGFSTNFTWKDITLGLFFSYSVGSKVRMNNLYSNSGQRLPNPQQNMSAEFVDRWREPGDEAHTIIPALSTDPLQMNDISFSGSSRTINIGDNRWQMYNQSDIRVVSGDFLRLRTAYIRYSIPEKICRKMRMNSASVRVEGNNLFVVCSKDLNGQDPEQLGLGSIGITTPPVASFSFGLDITF